MKVLSVIVLLFSATLLYGQAATPATAPGAALGRYQLVAVGAAGTSEVWLIDTQTGDTWRRQGSRWLYSGNPTQDPGPNAPAPRTPATRPTPPPILPERPN